MFKGHNRQKMCFSCKILQILQQVSTFYLVIFRLIRMCLVKKIYSMCNTIIKAYRTQRTL